MDDTPQPMSNSLNSMKGSGQVMQDADEIDLFELWNGLVQERWFILASAIIVTLLAGAYAFWATPIYQSKAYFLPPSVEDVQEMNSLNLLTNKPFYKPDEVYEDFIKSLRSREVLKQAFNKYGLVTLYEKNLGQVDGAKEEALTNRAFEKFAESFKLQIPKVKSASQEVSAELALALPPEKTAQILNEIVGLAEHGTSEQYLRNIQAELQIRKQRISDQIASLRQIEKERRLDRVAQLQEAANIARSLDFAEPISMGPQVKFNGIANQGMPLYYLGYKLLEAELSALKSRQNDDPFIANLRGLQQQLSELENLKIDADKFGVVTIDQLAVPDAKPIKPKRALIIAVGAVLGLMLGVFVALIRRAVKNRRQGVVEVN
ncbi:LPS O-antigen chain length determinant protein WzzB [Thiomicrorhabdus sp.]|uniref:LPS O-antigen chain length determinant protein WzzB n=1 Tax=Thiomicrorhabdus sp. TaxID=2039724 RepID=UPI0035619D1D